MIRKRSAFSAEMDSSLHNDVQALLKEVNRRNSSHRGWDRWTLEKKVETDPSCSVPLIQILVKELQKKLKRIGKIDKTRSYLHVIPLLHTFYYVVIQSGSMIPACLYQEAYDCLTKMLILPLSYSAVAQSTLRRIKMEMSTPGSLYLRRVAAEQNLTNEHEKVFVLADPAVFSTPMEATVRGRLDLANTFRGRATIEKNLVLHVLQKGLGSACQSSRITQALEALGDQIVEQYFQEVVVAMEQNLQHSVDDTITYISRLQRIHHDILAACKEERAAVGGSHVRNTPMPFPQISFYLWKDENELCKLLENFAVLSLPADKEEKDKRDSVLSGDSGIETDLKDSETEEAAQSPSSNPRPPLPPKNAMRVRNSAGHLSQGKKMETSPVHQGDIKHLTARVVVMGDDRVLGRLTRAYTSFRNKDLKRLMLRKKLNLQLYYIPVTAVEPWHHSPDRPSEDEGRLSLAFMLGRVDPWYSYNISTLGLSISRMPVKQCNQGESSENNLPLLETLCYYLRCGTQSVNLPIYSVKMTRLSHGVPYVEEDVFVCHLEAEIPEFKHLKQTPKSSSQKSRRQTVGVFGGVITVSYTATRLSKRELTKGEPPMTCGVVMTSEPEAMTTGEDFLTVKFDSMNPQFNTKIQTRNISVKAMENRTLSVCLDKDIRRTYTNVQKLEVSPCLDPRSSVLPLSKYLDKFMSLPINTFSGVSP